jgi:hypothetical protein
LYDDTSRRWEHPYSLGQQIEDLFCWQLAIDNHIGSLGEDQLSRLRKVGGGQCIKVDNSREQRLHALLQRMRAHMATLQTAACRVAGHA